MTISYWVLAAALVAAAVNDLRASRISNWITFPAAAAGLVLGYLAGGAPELQDRLLGLAVTGGIWFVFWKNGLMGGGDQKLMMAVGSLLGKDLAITAAIAVAIAGGVQSLLWIFIRWQKEKGRIEKNILWKKTRVPYSLAIAAGTLSVLALFLLKIIPENIFFTP